MDDASPPSDLIRTGEFDDIVPMRFDPQAGLTNFTPDPGGRRSRGRLEQESVRCDLGTVLDLSRSGMRLVCRRVPHAEFSTRIRGLGADLTVRGRVIWSRKIGFRKSEVGVEFIGVTPELAQQLMTMAMNNRFRRAV